MIEIRNLTKSFQTADGAVDALRDVSLTIQNGDIYGIIGMSGAGKSTLVRCINMLEKPTQGQVLLDGQDLATMKEKDLRKIRRRVTMIFQGFNLLMQRTCLQNIMLPLRLAKVPVAEAKTRALELLNLVGLPDKVNAYPAQLSGGQQQRIAIARALATNPEVLLCDEATSALDPKTTHSILGLIHDINQKLGITVIVITHQMSVVQEICSKVAILENGAVVEEGEVSKVFSNPQAEATRNLVYPEMADSVVLGAPSGQRVRIIFNGAVAAKTPLLAQMAMECGIPASILSASTRSVGDRAYGYMMLEIPGDEKQLQIAVDYLSKTPDVTVQIDDGRLAGVEVN